MPSPEPPKIKLTLAPDKLVEKLHTGEVQPANAPPTCDRQETAPGVSSRQDGLGHFRYLDRSPVPDVIIERDIGSPPPFLAELARHVRTHMTDPATCRRYGIRKTAMRMLAGPVGSGMGILIDGFIRRMAEIMSEVTGTPIDDLPPRVLRMRMEQILSMWLGQSEKELDRFFDEAVELYDRPFVAPSGKEYHLPVLAVCRDIDALCRVRGGGCDAVHDRVQTALLRRLDRTRPEYRDRLIVFLLTTNLPERIDPAFLRCAGGSVEPIGRLRRAREFRSVLARQVRDLPFHGTRGDPPRALERRAVDLISTWLFSPDGGERGQVELTFAGSDKPVRKYRRSFLTRGLVARAVQQAAAEACRAEELGCGEPGIAVGGLAKAFDEEIHRVVDQLTPRNVGQYVDLPDGEAVTRIRKIDQPEPALIRREDSEEPSDGADGTDG